MSKLRYFVQEDEQGEFDFDDYFIEVRKSWINRQLKLSFIKGLWCGATIAVLCVTMVGLYYGN